MAFLQEYTMLDELGKGGFATVYKVRHNELGYIRAVRVLNETIVAKEGDDPKRSAAYQKFLRECKVLLRLGNGNHPNIVHIYKPDLLDNKALVEMDYVDGQDIMHYLKANKNCVPTEEVIRMALQISSALAYCHEDIYRFCMDRDEDKLQDDPNDGSKVLIDDKTRKKLINKYKVIHNDIHSGNIMRREDGNFVLLDFGLAINGDEVVRSSRHKNGAPEFKAPEKWDNEAILTEQSDIYSFGIVLYQYLAGRVPFPYDTKNSNGTAEEFKLMNAHKETLPPSIEAIRKEFFERKFEGQHYERDYPQWLEDAILKCLRKNPAERFKNGKELYDFIVSHANTANALCNDVEMERLTSENKEFASQVNDLRSANRNLNDQLNSKQNECASLTSKLWTANEKIGRLEKELVELKKGKKTPMMTVLIILLAVWGVGASIYAFSKGNKIVEQTPNHVVIPDTIYQTKGKTNTKIVHDTIYQTVNNDVAVKRLETQISQLNQQIESYRKQISQKNEEIRKMKSASTSSSGSSSSEVAKLNEQIKKKDAEIKRLNNDLKQKISDLEKANREIAVLRQNLN